MHNASLLQAFPTQRDTPTPTLSGATLVLPAVTHANMGELSMDVLISSLMPVGLSLAARLEEENCLPVAGNDAYNMDSPGSLSTAMELYHMQGTTTYFLQQRAPAMKGRQAAFASNLASWLQQQGVKEVFVLCGLDALTRKDKQIMGAPLRSLCSIPVLKELCSVQGVAELEDDYLEEEKKLHGGLPPWPLLDNCQQHGIPYLLLTSFVGEGDNQADGFLLARQTLALLAPSLSSKLAAESLKLSTPCSWAALYGRSMLGMQG